MPDPVQVTITDNGITPCNITLYQNPSNGANSVVFTNDASSTATWSLSTASSFLSDQAPPNGNNPASNSYNITASGTLQLWVKDNAAVGAGVTKQYNISVNGNNLACTTADPPDMQIDP
jgi:hypothetical protein